MKKLLSIVAVVAVVAFTASSAFAASPLRSIGVEAGYVSPDIDGLEDTNTWVAGLFADFGLPMTNLYINPFVNYWNWSESDGSTEVSLRDFAMGANVKFTIPTASVKVQPFLAGGVGVHMLNASAQSGGIELSEGETKFGFQGGAGLKIGVSQSANIVTSGWYHVVEDVNNWSLRAGMAWNL